MSLYSNYNIRRIKASRKNRKTSKQIANTYFIITTLMISFFTISALSVLNYSINNNNLNYNKPKALNNSNLNINYQYNLNIEQEQNSSCAYCRDLVNIINLEYEKYGKTIEDIVDIIKNICTLIHAPIVSQECVFISNNIEKILNWTNSGMNSTVVCRKLHLCNDNLPLVISR